MRRRERNVGSATPSEAHSSLLAERLQPAMPHPRAGRARLVGSGGLCTPCSVCFYALMSVSECFKAIESKFLVFVILRSWSEFLTLLIPPCFLSEMQLGSCMTFRIILKK
ncbi:hypothetical protein EUGRSUZ_K02374 [Eucalyptus grandis]|uniref:Uncharacterized protein n=2 Tax=Eucalyptus grandis TaxID=71139 RepID=A0ACC3IW81_EUCGR|nr:hypothetical protein EUGRSUZ_K02374 [Eucalyptus grandis]